MSSDRAAAPALIAADGSQTLTHGNIAALAEEFTRATDGRRLVFHFGAQTMRSISLFRAAVDAGAAVALLDAGLGSEFATELIERYQPDVLVGAPEGLRGAAYQRVLEDVWLRDGEPADVHPDLSILLSTSGSTGSPKFVRLSRENVAANTEQIIASLGITADDRAITALPLFYSYGMSVINTHLAAGGAVVVTSDSVFDPGFWQAFADHRVSFLNGVPSSFAMLRRLRIENMDLPALRAITQAGGKLNDKLIEHFAGVMGERGGDFFVMYGQTEAAPRITCRSVNGTEDRAGSVGPALRGGVLEIIDLDGAVLPAGESGEVRYRGPNVMMGYAETAADLALGDVHGDALQTGDLGHLDDDGFLYITGRSKRIAKVSGLRISLDEVEQLVADRGPVAAVPRGDDAVVVYCEWDDDDFRGLSRELTTRLKLPPKSIVLEHIEAIPVLNNGKTDYQSLQQRS
ncbi:AMP-binding protein [Epidermidibacterium keratini]|uniref:AMP-binding protein n=1 Tax=Epidermidibacterium keratini TaxID=1891644 RepID=A0A7L4YPG7_9ACTN|nr:AMP-binding protein [Epidermidibacterium keratini]QHC00699.1 AMP-binding protein [Epidermidibacterium keratini]